MLKIDCKPHSIFEIAVCILQEYVERFFESTLLWFIYLAVFSIAKRDARNFDFKLNTYIQNLGLSK